MFQLPPSLRNKEDQPVVNSGGNPPEPENTTFPSPEAQEYEKTRDSLDKLLQQLKKCELPSSNEAIERQEFSSFHEGNQTGRSDNQRDVAPDRANENVDEVCYVVCRYSQLKYRRTKRIYNRNCKIFKYHDIVQGRISNDCNSIMNYIIVLLVATVYLSSICIVTNSFNRKRL